METATLFLNVHAGSTAEATELAADLEASLNRHIRGIDTSLQKERDDTLDPGTLVVAILGTKFAVELAKTLHAWLMRNSSATISIGANGKLDIKNLTFEQVEKLVSTAFTNATKEK
jgi:hypothetical protein